MGEIRRRVSAAMTGQADMGKVALKSLALGGAATLFTVPYFSHLLSLVPVRGEVPLGLGFKGFLWTEMSLLFIICLLSAMVGFSFAGRSSLPGFGDFRKLKGDVSLLLGLAAVMTILSLFLFDRHFIKISPGSYPRDILYLLSYPFKAAFADEVILRFCLVTLGVGLLRSRVGGVVLVSAIASTFAIKYFQFLGMGFGLNVLFVTQWLLSFSAHLLLGFLFVTRGLVASMTLNFLFGVKYAVVAWAGGWS